jgi:DNA-binding transcriptional LysR family regulator
MPTLTLADLRVFCAVAQNLSVTQAAHLLCRAQPAVSRQIAELEKDLGVSLFFRRGRRLELTPAGEELLGRSQALLEDAGNLAKRAQQLAVGNTSVLRIGAMAGALHSFFPSLLLAFSREWPKVTIRIVEADAPELVHLLEVGQLDLALTRDYLTGPTLATTRLFPMSMIAVVAASHRLAGKETLGVEDLECEPLLLMQPGSASRVLISRACQAEGLTLRDIRMESRMTDALVTLAEGGFGIAVLMSALVTHPPKARVIPVHLRGEHLGIWYCAIWLRSRTGSDHVDAFVKAARKLLKENFPGKGYTVPGLP